MRSNYQKKKETTVREEAVTELGVGSTDAPVCFTREGLSAKLVAFLAGAALVEVCVPYPVFKCLAFIPALQLKVDDGRTKRCNEALFNMTQISRALIYSKNN